LLEHGVLVTPNDAAAFCDGLSRLVGDEGLRREAGERGRRFVEQNYSKDRLLTDVANLYRELAEEKQTIKSKVQSPKSKVKKKSSTLDIGL
ncbi:MAG: hypothetical protein LC672_05805, partial [Acidobacteria bacterium]|nr:hypothetical protein [Acidobacteriota bacterium]